MTKTDINYHYLVSLYKQGYITGYVDGTFRPNNPITRGELLKLIFLVKGVSLSHDTNDYFCDITTNSWQKKYVNTAVSLGIITKGNTQFLPQSYISRVEALKMILLLFVGNISCEYTGGYQDVSPTDWFAKYVQYAWEKQLLIGKNHLFFPQKSITRYEVIQILRLLSGK